LNDYSEEKKQRTMANKTGQNAFMQQEDPSASYKKLYKQLGDRHNNKDVRREVQAKLDERPENTLSPGMWLGVNPSYHYEEKPTISEAKTQFSGVAEERCDKIYFRRKDEQTKYTECRFQNKILTSKK
jgi:hypothetical protein